MCLPHVRENLYRMYTRSRKFVASTLIIADRGFRSLTTSFYLFEITVIVVQKTEFKELTRYVYYVYIKGLECPIAYILSVILIIENSYMQCTQRILADKYI